MKRVIFIAFAFLIGLSASANDRRPNILMIAVDDLRPMLGCYGHAFV